MISTKLCHNLNHSLQKNSHSLPLGRFCQERCLHLSDRNSILSNDNNLCLHNSSGSYGAPNANLLDFMFLLVVIGKVCVHLQMSSIKTQMLLLEKNISTDIDSFVIGSSCSHL